jgi:hypothetical protein
MATMTYNGMTFTLTMDEMMELVKGATKDVVARPAIPCETVSAVVEAASASKMHTLSCGCSVPRSRGRYPASCDSCKAKGAKGAKRSGKGSQAISKRGRRVWTYTGGDWENEPASQRQIDRILSNLEARRVPVKIMRASVKQINAGLTGKAASELYNYIKTFPMKAA